MVKQIKNVNSQEEWLREVMGKMKGLIPKGTELTIKGSIINKNIITNKGTITNEEGGHYREQWHYK